jgi:hypothetical protein
MTAGAVRLGAVKFSGAAKAKRRRHVHGSHGVNFSLPGGNDQFLEEQPARNYFLDNRLY